MSVKEDSHIYPSGLGGKEMLMTAPFPACALQAQGEPVTDYFSPGLSYLAHGH